MPSEVFAMAVLYHYLWGNESLNSNTGGHVYKYLEFHFTFIVLLKPPCYAMYVVYLDAVRGGENFVVNSYEGDHECIWHVTCQLKFYSLDNKAEC